MKFESFKKEVNNQPSVKQENSTDKKTPENIQEFIPQIMEEAEKLEIKSNDRNEKGELLVSPDGPVSNLGKQNELWWKIARTESFKKFFGDWQNSSGTSSKIVDKNGEPIVLFRGIRKDISLDDFYNQKFYEKGNTHGPGVYLSPNLKTVKGGYADNDIAQGMIIPTFVNAKKPKYTDSFAGSILDDINTFKKKIILKIPKSIMNNLPKISINIGYDSVFGGSTNLENPVYRMSLSEHTNIEEICEIVIRDSNQVLIIPNSIDLIKKN